MKLSSNLSLYACLSFSSILTMRKEAYKTFYLYVWPVLLVYYALPRFLSFSSQSHDETAMMVRSPCHDIVTAIQGITQIHTGLRCQVVYNVAMDDMTVNTLSGSCIKLVKVDMKLSLMRGIIQSSGMKVSRYLLISTPRSRVSQSCVQNYP